MIPLKANAITETYKKFFENALKAEVNKDEFTLPTLASFVNAVPEAYDHYVAQYDHAFGEQKWYNQGTANSVKIAQAMLLDGLAYGYNLTTGAFELFTADTAILKNLEGGFRGYSIKALLNQNEEGYIYAKRIDVNYNTLNGTYVSKATNLIGKQKLADDNYLFVPYTVINLLITMLVGLLQRGKVLEFGVQEGNIIKSRVSTLNRSVADTYGSTTALETMPIIDLRLEGKIYIPVLGAPITTMGLSNIRFQNLSYLKILDKASLQALNIKPADNSVDTLIRTEIVSSFISRIFADENRENRSNLFTLFESAGAKVSYSSSRLEYIKSLRYLTPEQFNHIWNCIEGSFRKYEGTAKSIITGFKPVITIPRSPEAFAEALKEGLYKITYLKPDGKFAMVYATNNYEYLVKSYGNRFIRRKESHTDKLIYLKSVLSEANWIMDDNQYKYYIDFFGLNTYLGNKSKDEVIYMLQDTEYPLIKSGTMYDGIVDGVGTPGVYTSFDFSMEEDTAPTQGTADNRVKVRSLFNLKGSPIPFTRKIDPATIYSMARLDI